jgi:1,4-dihydroxy-2-naphthoyl-CoA hydrolase
MMRSLGRAGAVTGASLGAMTDTAPSDDRPTPAAADPRSLTGALVERMGIAITEAGPERTAGTMPVEGNTQPAGLLHGGASAVLAETLGSVAATLHAGPGRAAVGLELNVTHHRGMRDGVVSGLATAVHLGRSTASYEIVVRDEQGRRVCTARLTCMLLDVP